MVADPLATRPGWLRLRPPPCTLRVIFAAGLALKAKLPRAPTWGLLLGVGFLDLLFGPFVLAGIERASLTPEVSPSFSLDYID